MNAFITAQGFTTFSMVSVLIGAVCNIVLDPVFIFCFSYGGTRCCTGNCYLTGDFHTLGSFIPLRQKDTASPQEKASPSGGKSCSSCIALGLAAFIMQSSESIVTVCFNSSCFGTAVILQWEP